MGDTILIGRKDQIKQTAQNLFREKGYVATSMRDLAKVVGIEPASLYSHISSKEEILKDICFGIADDFFEAIEGVFKYYSSSTEKLRSAIIAHIEVIKNNNDASVVFFHEWKFLTGQSLSDFKSLRKKYENLFRKILEEGKLSGEFSDFNLKIVLPSLFAAMNWTHEWQRQGENFDPIILGEEIFNLIFKGIKN